MIEFDGSKVLLAQNVENMALIDLVNQNDYDIIFVGNNQSNLPNSKAKVVSNFASKGNLSFEEQGNFSILLEENLSIRGLD